MQELDLLSGDEARDDLHGDMETKVYYVQDRANRSSDTKKIHESGFRVKYRLLPLRIPIMPFCRITERRISLILHN